MCSCGGSLCLAGRLYGRNVDDVMSFCRYDFARNKNRLADFAHLPIGKTALFASRLLALQHDRRVGQGIYRCRMVDNLFADLAITPIALARAGAGWRLALFPDQLVLGKGKVFRRRKNVVASFTFFIGGKSGRLASRRHFIDHNGRMSQRLDGLAFLFSTYGTHTVLSAW